MKKIALFFTFCFCSLFAKEIETFYGTVEVDEPVLLELIESPAFQRLKEIHQYGVGYYTTHREEFTRFEHSLGVFHLLRANGRSLEEQIAGLLHDVSHTIFSHVGDWIFNQQNNENDYQSLTHEDYIEKSGLETLLQKYGLTAERILPKEELFAALEKPLPNLCADRLDYNIQGAYHQGVITHEEALTLFHDIVYQHDQWITHESDLIKKLARFSYKMSLNCWGSPTNYILSMWLAEAILRGLDIGLVTMNDIRFGVDKEIWNRLTLSSDLHIQNRMDKIMHSCDHIHFCDIESADLLIKSKFRGIDPFILVDDKLVRLTSIDPLLAHEYTACKEASLKGWAVKFSSLGQW